MPRCEGLPGGACPERKNDQTIKLGEGDLMLCPSCDSIRFRQFCESRQSTVIAAGATKKAKTKSQKEATSDGIKKSGPNPDITVSTKSVCEL